MTSEMADVANPRSLPQGLVLTYYADDFSGATDVMEVLTKAGLPTTLFIDPPSTDALERFPGIKAFGVAGRSRSMETGALDQELPPILRAVGAHRSALFHLKICSTFDSSPHVGSIGRSIEHCLAAFGPATRLPIPLLVGAPALNRYSAFGNLFARSGPESDVFRLDRHPTMSCHPTTPMQESDLRQHLERQTDLSVGLIDVLDLERGIEHCLRRLKILSEDGADIVLYDNVTPAHQHLIGRLLWTRRDEDSTLSLVGSSGIEYALTDYWQTVGLLPKPPFLAACPVDRLLVVSGSCSPVTDRQIGWGIANGFVEIALDPLRLLDPQFSARESARVADLAILELTQGRSVVIHLCRGPNDPRIEQFRRHCAAEVYNDAVSLEDAFRDDCAHSRDRLAIGMGDITQQILYRSHMAEISLKRVVIAGGDTSGVIARSIGIEALEMLAPVAAGSPLCRVHSCRPETHGLEILFKGGQVGSEDLFARILSGSPGG